MIPISVTVLTKNSEKHLEEMLFALSSFDEVLLLDNGSTDHTLEIASRFPNVNLIRGTFIGFGPTHNLATSHAKHDWILSVDSDEIVTPELVKEIQALRLREVCVYSIPRHNEFNQRWIRWCGWYPEQVVRLYNRKKTRFSQALVHEGVETNGLTIVDLKNPLRHFPYDKVSDFLAKMQMYTDLFAKENAGKKNSSPLKASLHGFWAFFRSYIIKRGILGGYEGFLISSYNGHCAFYKYIKLYEANQLIARDP